jgi:hypothetical protein
MEARGDIYWDPVLPQEDPDFQGPVSRNIFFPDGTRFPADDILVAGTIRRDPRFYIREIFAEGPVPRFGRFFAFGTRPRYLGAPGEFYAICRPTLPIWRASRAF